MRCVTGLLGSQVAVTSAVAASDGTPASADSAESAVLSPVAHTNAMTATLAAAMAVPITQRAWAKLCCSRIKLAVSRTTFLDVEHGYELDAFALDQLSGDCVVIVRIDAELLDLVCVRFVSLPESRDERFYVVTPRSEDGVRLNGSTSAVDNTCPSRVSAGEVCERHRARHGQRNSLE